MKKLFSFFSMLVLVVLSVGCSDNEDKLKTHYEPFEVEESHGALNYDTKTKQWWISTLDLPNSNPKIGDLQTAYLLVEDLPKEYEVFKDEWIKFSGVAQFLKHDDKVPTTLYFSFKLQNMKSDDERISRSTVENFNCNTTFSAPPAWYHNMPSRSVRSENYVFDIFVHVIRDSSGNGSNKETISLNMLNMLNEYYSQANISFYLKGNEYIDSNSYNNFTVNLEANLFNENPHNDAIDIYVLSDKNYWNKGGLAQDVLSTACIIRNDYYNTPVMAHEVGHCLGLYHTHHGTVEETGDSHQCAELVDGSNSDVCGDYIIDTPADPNIWDGCNYTGSKRDANGDLYNPDPTNIMSYAAPQCMSNFTAKQIEKMYLCIENSPVLQTTLHNELAGEKHFCTNGVYSIEGLANNETANWTVTKYYPSSTADDQPLSSQTTTYSGSSITLNASNQSAYYVIQATINGTTTLTKTVTSYVPSPYVGTLAWETTDGQFGVTTNMEHGNTLYVSGTKTLSLEYLDQGGNTEANFTCITAANRYLSGSTITLQTSDCTRDLKIRTSNSCGTSGNFFTIPCEVTSYSYNLNLNNSTLSIDVEETAKASLASALSIRESDIKTSGDIQSIKVRNADGQVIFTKNYSVATKGVRINTSSWLPGEYILEITNGDMTQKRKIRVK